METAERWTDHALTPLEVAQAREDVNAFIEYTQTDEQTGQRFLQADIHRAWHAHIDQHTRALIIAPREHGKTDQLAIGRVLWELGKNPQLRIKIVCQDDDHAAQRLVAIEGQIERNPRVRQVFPGLRKHPSLDNWSKHTATVDRRGEDKDPSVEALGVLSAGTGGRADLIIFDDVVDLRNAIQLPALREAVKTSINNVWLNLLTKNGRAVYVATPWHEDDATHEMEKKATWVCLKQPIPESLEPIWWEQWPRTRLIERQEEIGPRAFARGFFLRALSDEDTPFRNITACIRPDLSRLHIKDHWPRFTGVDLGHSKRKDQVRGSEKPYTIIFTIATDERHKRWPMDVRRGHWSGPETAAQVVDVYQTHSPEVILFENNAYQDTFSDWCRLASVDSTIPLQPFTTGAQKADEQIGLPGLAAEFDALNWIVPTDGIGIDDTARQIGPLWAWIAEMKSYPVGALSDTVMACWFAREASRPRFAVRLPFDRDKVLELKKTGESEYGEGE